MQTSFNFSNIASAINAAHAGVEAAKREGSRSAVECGKLLHEAKATVPHGQWDAWVRRNCKFSMRTAQLYMRVATHVAASPEKAQRVADISLRDLDRQSRVAQPAVVSELKMTPAAESLFGEWKASTPASRIMFARMLLDVGDISDGHYQSMIEAAEKSKTIDKEEASKRIADFICRHAKDNADFWKVRGLLRQSGEQALVKALDIARKTSEYSKLN